MSKESLHHREEGPVERVFKVFAEISKGVASGFLYILTGKGVA